jgi:AraC-like DNA-binding protein
MGITARYFDAELGRWTHTEWQPSASDPLAWAVDRVWDFDGMAAHPQERVFPSGHVELILQLDDRYLDVLPHGLRPTPMACVTGIQTRPIVVRAPPRPVRVLGVRMHPVGAWGLLRHPLHELGDRTSDLDEVLGRPVAELAECCAGACSGIDRVRFALAWLRRRLLGGAAFPAHPAARWVASRIANSGGREPIAPLRRATGLSDARLGALFREQVGITPKRLARIHRFDRALALLTGSAEPLVRIAHDAGYYDQPHMNAEFRELAGLTPRELLAATRYPNSLSLAESA